MTVRAANAWDVPEIMSMGRSFFRQTDWGSVVSFDEDSLKATVEELIQHGGVLLVAEQDGQLCGMAACILFPLYFNRAAFAAQELFWYIDPSHRNGIGIELLDALERAAKERGAAAFLGGAVAGMRDAAVAALYARRGYRPLENTFVKAL